MPSGLYNIAMSEYREFRRYESPGGKRLSKPVTAGQALRTGRLITPAMRTVHDLLANWAKVVGDAVAEHSSPEEFRAGDLTVNVDDPIWIQELSFLKDDIAAGVREYLGRKAYLLKGSVRFKNGKVTRPAPEAAGTPVPAELDAASAAEIERAVSDVDDPKLRESLKHYLTLSKLNEGE